MNTKVTYVIVGVAALGLGGTAGYLFGKKRAEKKADKHINEVNTYWSNRIEEYEGPAVIITSGENLQVPSDIDVDGDGLSIRVGDEISFGDNSYKILSELNKPNETDEDFPVPESIPEDFPDEVTEDFTVEGESPSVDARAFIEQFKNRTANDFGGVSFPGQVDDRESDAEVEDIPLRTVPEFIVVRDPHGPYVISIDDFMDPETDPPFTKVEMRYFKGDNVVVDARDQQVPMSSLGQRNMERFGEGTTDPSQVYIRNERLGIDIELTMETGLYLHEVLGQDFPDKSTILTMRESDDN